MFTMTFCMIATHSIYIVCAQQEKYSWSHIFIYLVIYMIHKRWNVDILFYFEGLPEEVFQAFPTGRRVRGRPKKQWKDCVT